MKNGIKAMFKRVGGLVSLTFLIMIGRGMAQSSYALSHLNVTDGLSNNYVLDVECDKRGLVWIATESGLNRFDGYDFVNYQSVNSGLPYDALQALYYDEEENRLWIGSKFHGVSWMDCDTYGISACSDTIMNELGGIVKICRAADGGVWIVPSRGDIIYYNKEKRQFTPLVCEEARDAKWAMIDDGKGRLFIGFKNKGLGVLDLADKSMRLYNASVSSMGNYPAEDVHALCQDHAGNIWVGSGNGLALFDPSTDTFTAFRHDPNNPHSLIANPVYDIREMKNGELWVASDIGGISILDLNGIAFKNPDKVRFRRIDVDDSLQGLSSRNPRSLMQDAFGNIWIGHYSSGIDFISHIEPVFHVLPYIYDERGEMRWKPVWGIACDEQNRIWIGGENELAVFEDNVLRKRFDLSSVQLKNYWQVFSILPVGDVELLLGFYNNGLIKFDAETGRMERIPLDIPDENVICFHKEENGTVWIGAQYGLYRYKDGRLVKDENLNRQLPELSVYGVVRDRQGKLWVGTYSCGIVVFDAAGKKVHALNVRNGFCSDAVNGLFMDKEGGIWAATRNGLGYIPDTEHPENTEHYGYEEGLKDIFVRAITEDLEGNLWLSTNNGISRWNKGTGRFENYDYQDGIPSGNFIENSVCRTTDGKLYFGSLGGVCYFHPGKLSVSRQVSEVKIVECNQLANSSDGQVAANVLPVQDGRVEIPYQDNSFRISFAVSDFAQSTQVEYAYQIEGLSEEWTNTQGDNQVTLRDVAPGTYVFKVKSRLRNHPWDEAHFASLQVKVLPPLWLTWYAKLVYVLLAVGIIAIGFRFYKRKLLLESSLELEKRKSQNEQDLNNERLRFYTNITHELRTPLTLILGPLEDLLSDKKLPDAYTQKIGLIYKSALRLLNLINQILEFRKTETQNRKLTVNKGNLSDAVMEIGLRYKELNHNPNVTFDVRIEDKSVLVYFDADMIASILNNLLSNAVKYTPEGKVWLSLRQVEENSVKYVEIQVGDTGYGIEKEALPHIFERYYQAEGKHQASGTGIGLALVKALADLHEGTLKVESEVGKGTVFTFRILADNTYPDALHKEAEEKVPETKEQETESVKDGKPLLLVVEDNTDIKDYIVASFSGDYRLQTASDGKEGWDKVASLIPDMVISDVMMPVMDGIELCKRIKKDIRTSHIPVILLTAKDSLQDKQEGYDSGADSYLTKPFSAKLLASRVHNLLDARKRLAKQLVERMQHIQPEQPPLAELGKLDEVFLQRFTEILEANLADGKADMAFMAEQMHISHSTLYRKIKGLTGMTGNEFIRKIKLKHSLRLLLEKGYNVSEAAYASGFNDLGYFRTCFKEEYGHPPTEYLKRK